MEQVPAETIVPNRHLKSVFVKGDCTSEVDQDLAVVDVSCCFVGNGNDPPTHIPYLEISDEKHDSPNNGLSEVL